MATKKLTKEQNAEFEQWRTDQQVNLLLAAVVYTNRKTGKTRGGKRMAHYLYIGGSSFAFGLAIYIAITFDGSKSAMLGLAASLFGSAIFAITAKMTQRNGR